MKKEPSVYDQIQREAVKAQQSGNQHLQIILKHVQSLTQASPTIRKVAQTGLTPVLRGQPRTGQASAGRRLSED